MGLRGAGLASASPDTQAVAVWAPNDDRARPPGTACGRLLAQKSKEHSRGPELAPLSTGHSGIAMEA